MILRHAKVIPVQWSYRFIWTIPARVRWFDTVVLPPGVKFVNNGVWRRYRYKTDASRHDGRYHDGQRIVILADNSHVPSAAVTQISSCGDSSVTDLQLAPSFWNITRGTGPNQYLLQHYCSNAVGTGGAVFFWRMVVQAKRHTNDDHGSAARRACWPNSLQADPGTPVIKAKWCLCRCFGE